MMDGDDGDGNDGCDVDGDADDGDDVSLFERQRKRFSRSLVHRI